MSRPEPGAITASRSGRAGELLIVGFEGKQAPAELLARIGDGRVGGVILFQRNLGTLDEVARLCRSLAEAAPPGPPLFVAVDQEGGRVQRIKAPLPLWPPMLAVGAKDDLALSEAVGTAIGGELRALGFNVNFLPVLDVFTNPANQVIGDRAFGKTPEAATRHALACWRGLESAGVRGCGKHFPGHGDTTLDSHLDLPRVDTDEARLRAVELLPFAGAVRAGVPMMMTAHVVYPAIDPQWPATMSHRWLTEILRGELGFSGVIVSDDLDMKAVADRFPVEQLVVDSLLAGVDAFLACRDAAAQQKAEQALEAAAVRDPAVRRRIDESVTRLRSLRVTLSPPPAPDAWRSLPLDEHARLATKVLGSK